MRFKRLGATMLSGALSLSMILTPAIPSLAHTAEQDDIVNAVVGHHEIGDFIEKDTKVLCSYTKKQLEEMKAKNTQEYRDLADKIGADPVDNLDSFTITKVSGINYYVLTEDYYKNTLTGKSSCDAEDISETLSMPKTIAVNKGGFVNVTLKFANGEVGIKNLKSSKKKIATAVVEETSKDITNSKTKVISRDPKKNNKYYYTDAYGKKIYTNANTYINNSSGTVTLRIKGVASGSSVLSFDVVDRDNKKTGSKKITIKVADTQPFSKLTYAGKSLLSNPVIGAADENFIYAGNNLDKDASNAHYGYTTKKSGKLVVKMNKNYKLVKIEVGSLFGEKYNKYTKNTNKSEYFAGKQLYDAYTDAEQFNDYSGTIKNNHYVDLNGDGDYLDTINGVKETEVNFKYGTVRNNSTINLSKVTYATTSKSKVYNNSAYRYDLRRDANGNTVKDADDEFIKDYTLLDSSDYHMTSDSTSYMYAPTAIKITYYDKNEKNHKVFVTSIWYRVSKK